MKLTFRPLQWDRPTTPADARRSRGAFKAGWSDTLNLLAQELDHLDADHVVLQADFREQDIRLDGLPRANARQPEFPGIKITFDSRHGPLTYATDAHVFWQHNVRAIALALEALRAVDRYGVTHRAEQYTGWKAIEATPMQAAMTRREAAEWLSEHAANGVGPSELLAHPAMLRRAYRSAARGLHPDAGGDTGEFQQLAVVMELLS